jgi:hypothetical protein
MAQGRGSLSSRVNKRSKERLAAEGVEKQMSAVSHIVQRVAAFLDKRNNAAYCESCLVERLLIASRVSMKSAIETDRFTTRIGICPDCKTRKQVIGCRSGADSSKAA